MRGRLIPSVLMLSQVQTSGHVASVVVVMHRRSIHVPVHIGHWSQGMRCVQLPERLGE